MAVFAKKTGSHDVTEAISYIISSVKKCFGKNVEWVLQIGKQCYYV